MNKISKACMVVCIIVLIAPLAFFTRANAQTSTPDFDWSALEAITKDNLDRLTILAHAKLDNDAVTFVTSFHTGDSLLIGAILRRQHVYLLESDPSVVNIKALNSYPKPNAWRLAFSEQGNLLGVVAAEQVVVWNLTEEQLVTLPLPTSVFYDLEFRPQAGTLAIGAVDRIIEWNLITNSAVQTFVIPWALIGDIDFSPDGNLVAVGMGGGVTLVDWETNERIWLSITNIPNRKVLFSPDGTMLAYISEVGDDIALWDINENTRIQIKEQGVSEPSSNIYFSADGQLLWIITRDSGVEIYDGVTGEFIDTVDQLSDDVNTITFSPDGNLLVTGHVNGDVNIWGVLKQINN